MTDQLSFEKVKVLLNCNQAPMTDVTELSIQHFYNIKKKNYLNKQKNIKEGVEDNEEEVGEKKNTG